MTSIDSNSTITHTQKITDPTEDGSRTIRLLPQEVIDRIKAGESIQRASGAVKELIENAIDAGSTEIVVTCSADGLRHLQVQDNGCGMRDLTGAVTRHATSKLQTVEDLGALTTLGFRGEALASMVQVAKSVHIVSRMADQTVGISQSFTATGEIGPPRLCARKVGTTITLQQLFWNLPPRQRLKDEYSAILQTIQHYSVLYAARGIGFICQRQQGKNQTKVDVNSCQMIRNSTGIQSDDLTKRVVAQLFGSSLLPHLSKFTADRSPELLSPTDDSSSNNNKVDKSETPIHQTWGFATSPSYTGCRKTQFLLFINHRWVECHSLKKRLEALWPVKPFIFCAIQVPPSHVDVNIHPTKKQVALLFENDIINYVEQAVREMLKCSQQVFTTSQALSQSVKGTQQLKLTQQITAIRVDDAPQAKRKVEDLAQDKDDRHYNEDDDRDAACGNELNTIVSKNYNDLSDKDMPLDHIQEEERHTYKRTKTKPGVDGNDSSGPNVVSTQLSTTRVRTIHAAPQGALEPFLVPTQSQARQQKQSDKSGEPVFQHEENCPLRNPSDELDLTKPGAFAMVSSRCTCRQQQIAASITGAVVDTIRMVPSSSRNLPPLKVTTCSYTSIRQLRNQLPSQCDPLFRKSHYVGIISHNRSLLQCDDRLVLWNHTECAVEFFTQLALLRFGGGAPIAPLGQAINIVKILQSCLDDTNSLTAGDDIMMDTHRLLAEQAAMCLQDHKDMLEEYFSIQMQYQNGSLVITGLPELLPGYEPYPGGLPFFLLRLATEINWNEEKPCFAGISRELGYFYSLLPDPVSSTDNDDVNNHTIIDNSNDNSKTINRTTIIRSGTCPTLRRTQYVVQHKLFPAMTNWMRLDMTRKEEWFVTITSLKQLYRTFERC